MNEQYVDELQKIFSSLYEHEINAFFSRYLRNMGHTQLTYCVVDVPSELDDLKRKDYYDLVICIPAVNDFTTINQSFVSVHEALHWGGVFIGRVETLQHRKERIRASKNRFSAMITIFLEFLFKRALPKLPGFRFFYRKFRLLKHPIFSKCEALGRLHYCGFEHFDIKETDNYLYFIARKSAQPLREKPNDGMLIRVQKVGKDGRTIYCYKLRTMHAYANYLHNFILEEHELDKEGKVIGDFRKTTWGKFLRKTWLDELPQLYNIIKGDLSFIGYRPLSREFLSQYPEQWRTQRMKIKPGFVPPYYADCPKSFSEIIASEKRYYELKKKHPITTDIFYLMRVILNFIIQRARTG
jgi:hypothetical protein